MREGLAREFPEALRAVAWTRARAGPRTEPVLWAAISGIGAGFLVSEISQGLVGLANRALLVARSELPFALFPLATIAGSAAAAAVALAAGGPIALALELAYYGLGIALRIPGVMTFCERSGGTFPNQLGPDQCTAVGFLASLWPQLVGIGLGIALARAMTTHGVGINSLLRIAGSLAISLTVLSQIWAAIFAQSTNSRTSALTLAAGFAAAAVAAGVVAAQLPRGVRNATIIGAFWLLPWLTLQLPLGLQSLGPTVPPEFIEIIVVTIVIPPIATALLIVSAAVASRARFIPRDVA
ncbi:MAG: hypothetical protein M3O80_02945 [Chloroflexota bacterium]|nr:hypothetical protein [Chloroflexota bacterium]